MKERVDVAALNATLQSQLTAKGMLFNATNPDSFRDQLRRAGFYAHWKGKFGNEAWGILEASSGRLA